MEEILGAALLSFLGVVVATPFLRFFARKFGAIREPGGRHVHGMPTPLWGGAAIVLVTFVVVVAHPTLVLTPSIFGVFTGLLFLCVVGMIDDRRTLSWKTLLLAQVVAASTILFGGVRLLYVNGLFGDAIRLDRFIVHLPQIFCFGESCTLPVFGSLFVVAWVLIVMNAINWSDGSDGVAASVSVLAFTAVAFLAFRPPVLQPPIAIIAAVSAGASAGFLFYNFPPARIFLGSAGSMGLGFLLASVAVLAGAKVATVGMVLVLPAADAVAVMFARIMRRTSPTRGDTLHFHHLLLRRGFTQRRILAIHIAVSAVFGFAALLLPRPLKVFLLIGGFFLLAALLFWDKHGVASAENNGTIQ